MIMYGDLLAAQNWFEATAAPLLICREDRIVAANTAAARLFSLTAAELEGFPLGDLFSAADKLNPITETGAIHYRLRHAERWVVFSVSPLQFEGQPALLATFQDVTALHLIEAETQRQKQRFYAFADDLPDILCRFLPDERWTLTFVNDSFCAFFGGTRETLIGASYFEVMPASDKARAREHISILTPKQPTYLWEHMVMPRPDGSIRWQQWRDRAFFDSEGRVLEYQSIGQDITNRKLAEEIRNRSEHLLQEMGRLANVGGWEVDMLTSQLNWTEEVYHIHELPLDYQPTVEEAVNFYAPESLPILQAALEQAMAKGEMYDLELELITATGRRIWVHTMGVPHFEDGQVVRISGAFQDITERKQVERALRASEERLRTVVDNLPVVLFTLNNEGIYTFASGKRFITDPAGLIGINALSLYTGDPYFSDDHQRVMAGETIRRERNWGGVIYDTFYLPLRDPDGHITGALGLGMDITERKQMENALRDSEQRYRVLFEQAKDGIFILDMDGHYVDVNREAALMLGYTRDELLRMTYRDVVSGDEPDIRLAMNARLLAGEDIPTYERRYKRRDGTILLTEIKISLIRKNEYGDVLVQSIVRDITARKRAEVALRESQRRYQALFDQARDAIFILSMDGIHLEVNAEAARMLGYLPEEIVGQTFDFSIASGEEIKALSVIHDLKKGKRFAPYERLFRHRDGHIIPAEITVSAILDESGHPTHIQSIARDITERKRADEALRESEERYRVISGLISDYAFRARFVDDDAIQIEWITDSYTRVTGYTKDEVIGGIFFTTVHPDDRSLVKSYVKQVAAGQTTQGEYRIITKSGEVRWIHGHRHPIREADGRVTGFYTIAQDITERKRTEQMQREQEHLQVRLEKEMELSELKTKMMQRVSHEFRTPLSIILTSSDLLERHYERISVDRRQARFAQIVGQVNQMTRMLDDLALAVRGQFNHMNFQPVPFNLEQLCENMVQDMVMGIGAHHELVFECSGDLRHVIADSALIRLMINNLLSNAIKYSEVGKRVLFAVSVSHSSILLSVTDEGIGIVDEDRGRIFDPFYRGSNFDERPGLGLGLSIVQDAVTLHRGDIQVESRPGEGTIVMVRLPNGLASAAISQS